MWYLRKFDVFVKMVLPMNRGLKIFLESLITVLTLYPTISLILGQICSTQFNLIANKKRMCVSSEMKNVPIDFKYYLSTFLKGNTEF